jgi:hypothetical protein
MSIHPIQAMMDGMSAAWQRARAENQMTLGEMIYTLSRMPGNEHVANLREAHSYRGYYCDLAFERHEGTRPAAELLGECRAAMGEVFMGYKGGDYTMGSQTPVWVANYGSGGEKLMAFGANGGLVTVDDD